VNHQGDLYVTDPDHKQVWFISKSGEKRVVDKGIELPNGVLLTRDQSLLYVADRRWPGYPILKKELRNSGKENRLIS